MVSDERSVGNIRRIPCMWWVIYLLLLSGFSLSLDSLIMMCLGVVIFEFSLLGVCWASWMWRLMFSSNLGGFQPLFFKILILFFLLTSWDAHYVYIGVLDGVPQVSNALFIFLHSSFWSSEWISIELQSNLSFRMSPILNSLVLNQVVHRKNVLIIKQNFSCQPNNPFMLI